MTMARYPAGASRLSWRIDYFKATLGLMIAAYVAWFSFVSFRYHDLFLTNGFDLGVFDYIIWNNLHGKFFSAIFIGEKTHLSLHFQLILLPLSLIYFVWPSAKALLLVQSFILGLGALPIYWLAEFRLNKWMGLLFAAVYLLFPALQGANLAEFHTAPLAAGFLAFAYWYLRQAKFWMLVLFSLVAAACQEDILLIVGMLGFYLFVTQQDRRGLILGVAGWGSFLMLSMVVMPGFSPGRDMHFALHRYQALGTSLTEILTTLVTRPAFVWNYIDADPDRVRYLTHLLAPVAYFSLLDPLTLAIVLPTAVLNVLSEVRTMYALDSFQYSAVVVPFVVASAINGVAWLVKILSQERGFSRTFLYTVFGTAVLLITLGYHFQFGHTPLSPKFSLPVEDSRHQVAYRMLELIPAEAVVSAQSGLSPHLTHRFGAYLFPRLTNAAYGPAEYIALDLYGNIYPLEPESYSNLVTDLRASGDYQVAFEQDGYLLLQRQ